MFLTMARKNSIKVRKERHEIRLQDEREARLKRSAKLAKAKAVRTVQSPVSTLLLTVPQRLEEKQKNDDAMDTSREKRNFECVLHHSCCVQSKR